MSGTSVGGRSPLRAAVVVGALGVVFGDIGTSPIYTLQTVFNPADPHPVPLVRENVLGVVSLIVWSVVLIVTVTYVLLAMRVDNRGEGGILALITLLRRRARAGRDRLAAALVVAGVFGAALFLGDSMITPAISVLSAVEGVTVVRPGLAGAVVPATAVILLLLFAAQRLGTAAVGRLFGPVMITWFVSIGALGAAGVRHAPEVLLALSPTYAVDFLVGHASIAFFALAAVVLAVTGAEALYADMGHFGRRPIALGWLLLVFPACVLSYLGQGALLLDDPSSASAPFFLLAPDWARVPIVVLATAATVIASQAVITGAFSVAAQAAQLGYLPRLRVVHTSRSTAGQVYVPWINGLLAVAVLVLVLTFRSSLALAYAFGMAVTGTILVTTVLLLHVAWRTWSVPRPLLVAGFGVLIGVDLLFLAANLTKLVHGAWLPLALALTAFAVMTTWQWGRSRVTARRREMEGPLLAFAEDLRLRPDALTTVPGTAVFLDRGPDTTPLALRANTEHNRVRHERVVVLTVKVEPVPRVGPDERVLVDDLGDPDDGLTHVTLRFGYAERPDVPRTLATLPPALTEGVLDLEHATWFLSTIDLHPDDAVRGLGAWRTRLFLATSHLTADAAEHFGLPRERTVLMGARVEV
ncbi:KUP/HAK/KT family potassium transporter [Nocardioides sp. TRM66260-LWL]|uniref:potassium transporter Kup n=1 Tax=Nocardioides sp. TRM66260-LWL TaxID=2874478 RepID=UPI001CC3E8C4|nr:KUP/HAK/KT family potassium transporter [Nocardioides sp. TRM66260-LWL]MBZ5733455.1 KUP/HAK/KT family potassium transporter [Nocardioides sp. TRM66260-LWL]